MRIGLFTDTYPPYINGVSTSVYMLKKSLEKNDNNKKYETKVLLSSKSYEMQLKNTKEFIQKTLAQITEDKAKIKTENNAAKLETK